MHNLIHSLNILVTRVQGDWRHHCLCEYIADGLSDQTLDDRTLIAYKVNCQTRVMVKEIVTLRDCSMVRVEHGTLENLSNFSILVIHSLVEPNVGVMKLNIVDLGVEQDNPGVEASKN